MFLLLKAKLTLRGNRKLSWCWDRSSSGLEIVASTESTIAMTHFSTGTSLGMGAGVRRMIKINKLSEQRTQ